MNTSKIIRGPIGIGPYTRTAPITQWDYGYRFIPDIDDLPATYRIDFANNKERGEALSVYGDETGAEVPEELIDTGKDIYAFYYYVGDGYGKTAHTWMIPNHLRAKADREPTPSQQDSIDQLIVRSNAAVAGAEQSASGAAESAQAAANSAGVAAQSASQAAESASGTEEYATRAEAAQTAAETAQSAAQTAAATATQKASQASSAESAAASAAQTATAKAIEAAQIVEGVEEYAEAAEQSASSAAASADLSGLSARSAGEYASTASTKATEATTAAGTATTAKNDAVAAKTAAETAQVAAETAQEAAENAAESVSASAAQIATNTADISDIKENLTDKAPVIIESASGSIASFTDGADDMPMKSLVVNIDPVQSGSGDPSPDNVRPISGWTGVTAQRTGKNLLDLSNLRQGNYSGAMNSRNVSFDEHQPIKGGQTYVWSSPLNDISGRYLKFYDADKIELSGEVNLYGVGAKTFSVPSNARYFRCLWYRVTGIEPTDIVADQIELGSTATAYEPYQGNTYTIDWQSEAGTVYGGHIDVVSGELVVDRIIERPTSVTGSQIDTNGRCYIYTTGQVALKKEVYALAMCDMLASTTAVSATFAVSQYGGAGAIYFISLDSTYDTVAKYNAWLAENKPTIVLWLDEPITYHLTPTEVQSILGQNHVWADCGECNVEYRADTKLYIQRLTQPDTADMIADANITSGQYFMVGNSLYKATANIANGGQIIVGTNCTRKSLSEALNEINS